MTRSFLVALALTASVATTAAAQASPRAEEPSAAPAPPEAYDEAIRAALHEHEHANYQEARVHFQRAHELYPNARTLRGLGKVEFELRNYGESVRYLEQALASTVRPLDTALRTETERLLARARVYVGEVHVDVEPGSATVSVDGIAVASGPKASMSLLVGDHVLEFQAQGRLSQRRVIRVRGGEETVIQVVLPTPEPLTSADARRLDEEPLRKKWWVWTAAGVVVAGIATGIAVAASQRDPETRAASGGSTGTVVEGP